MLYSAIALNSAIVVCEIYTLFNVKKKTDILKYYTYLQNLIALIISVVFLIMTVFSMVCDNTVLEFVRGLRYIATCGLVTTTFIYTIFLARDKSLITEDDFSEGISPKRANLLLHYICPILSLISFIIFERQIVLTDGIWTSLSAVPSCGYWIIYLFLTIIKLWEEPYNFKYSKGGTFCEVLSMIFIPVSFIIISFVIWKLK